MEHEKLSKALVEHNIISEDHALKIATYETNKPFSIHWELRIFLYVGITLLGSGIGLLIYENIDTIGHNILIGLIVLVCVGCFYYAYLHRKSFTWQEVVETAKLDDFALLGGCITFLTLEGYLQYQYNVFGTRYGLAAFLPAMLFFFCAYRFDHRGVLSMAITALGSWVGVNIAPLRIWKQGDLSNHQIIITGILLGFCLILVGWISEYRNWKKHFAFTYFLFGGNLAFVTTLIALFQFESKMIYFLVLTLLTFLAVQYARQTHSFLFLLMGVIYGYIGLTYSLFYWMPDEIDFLLFMLYFMASGVGVIVFLINIKQIIGLKK